MLIRYLVAFLPTFHPWSAVLCISALCVSFCCPLCQLPSAWVRTIKGTMKRLGRRGEDWVLAYCHLASGSVLNEQCTSSMYPVHGRFSFCGCSFHLLPSWHHTSFLSLHIRDNLTSRCDSWTGLWSLVWILSSNVTGETTLLPSVPSVLSNWSDFFFSSREGSYKRKQSCSD